MQTLTGDHQVPRDVHFHRRSHTACQGRHQQGMCWDVDPIHAEFVVQKCGVSGLATFTVRNKVQSVEQKKKHCGAEIMVQRVVHGL